MVTYGEPLPDSLPAISWTKVNGVLLLDSVMEMEMETVDQTLLNPYLSTAHREFLNSHAQRSLEAYQLKK